MKKDRFKFKGSQSHELAAEFDYPDDGPDKYAVFAHCFTCNKNFKSINTISKTLTDNGYGVFRFDFTGLGESAGDFSETNFSTNVRDLLAAAEYMSGNYGSPQLLIGHSMGGAAVLYAGSRIESVTAVVTIGAPYQVSHLADILKSSEEESERKGYSNVIIAGQKFTLKKHFFDDLRGHDMNEPISGLSKPLLIMHSPIDKTVSIKEAAKIFAAARHPKSFISLDKADHLMSGEKDALYTGKIAAVWASGYVD
ncbi:MAG: alpha/beta hydrolase family protein [Candidatus Kapaibacterium sp.]